MRTGPAGDTSALTRRTALTHVGAAAAALGLTSRVGHVSAQETTPDGLARHPIVGAWMMVSLRRPSPPFSPLMEPWTLPTRRTTSIRYSG